MSSITDFLFEGKPPAPVTTYGSTVSNMPTWMSDYANSVLSGAAGAGSEPYQPYTGPRVAPLNPDQQAGFQATRDTVANQKGPLSLAQPYLDQAGKTFTGSNVTDYMNPYIQNVTDRNAALTGRAINEQLLPALASKFGSYGQDTRSSAYRAEADRGSRDLMESLQQQNNALLSQGYQQAGEQFSSDAGRNAQLAQIMGPLAQYQQQIGLGGANALQNIGATQQGETQKSLDTAYQDFQQQRDYPKTQISWMQSLLNGMPFDQSKSTSQDQIPSNYQPSGLSQVGSTAADIAGLLKMFNIGGSKRGGHIRFNRGGPLNYAFA